METLTRKNLGAPIAEDASLTTDGRFSRRGPRDSTKAHRLTSARGPRQNAKGHFFLQGHRCAGAAAWYRPGRKGYPPRKTARRSRTTDHECMERVHADMLRSIRVTKQRVAGEIEGVRYEYELIAR